MVSQRTMSEPVASTSIDNLRALLSLLTKSIDIIASSKTPLPSLSTPYSTASDAAYADPKILEAATIACAAARRLEVLVRPAKATLTEYMMQFYTPAALRTIMELHIPEILRAAGPKGMHISEIASEAKTDAGKLSRVLRHLSTQSVFDEVSPDVFANNRLSTIFDKKQDVEALQANRLANFDNPESHWAAALGHLGHESARAANFLYESLADEESATSGEASKAPFNRAFRQGNREMEGKTMWDMFEMAGHERELRRFGVAMRMMKEFDLVEAILDSFDWTSIPKGGKFVDVGGGIGTISKIVADSRTHFDIVIQDRSAVIADGIARWGEHSKEAISSGRVSFQSHDFFMPQPVKDASAFFMKMIMHDWSDDRCRVILGHLRDAAVPGKTKLLIMDRIVPYACKGTDPVAKVIPGLLKLDVPDVLPPNLGAWGPTTYHADLNMLSLFNGQERTIGEWVRLLDSTKWRIARVHQADPLGQSASLIESIPV